MRLPQKSPKNHPPRAPSASTVLIFGGGAGFSTPAASLRSPSSAARVLSAAPRPHCRASKALPLRGSSVCLRVVASPRAVPALGPDSSDSSDSSDVASLTRPLGCIAFLVVRRALAKRCVSAEPKSAQKRPESAPKGAANRVSCLQNYTHPPRPIPNSPVNIPHSHFSLP